MIKLNKIKRNCVAAVILTMCLMTAGCARNSTSTTTASGGGLPSLQTLLKKTQM